MRANIHQLKADFERLKSERPSAKAPKWRRQKNGCLCKSAQKRMAKKIDAHINALEDMVRTLLELNQTRATNTQAARLRLADIMRNIKIIECTDGFAAYSVGSGLATVESAEWVFKVPFSRDTILSLLNYSAGGDEVYRAALHCGADANVINRLYNRFGMPPSSEIQNKCRDRLGDSIRRPQVFYIQ